MNNYWYPLDSIHIHYHEIPWNIHKFPIFYYRPIIFPHVLMVFLMKRSSAVSCVAARASATAMPGIGCLETRRAGGMEVSSWEKHGNMQEDMETIMSTPDFAKPWCHGLWKLGGYSSNSHFI